MPHIQVNDINMYYEIHGAGRPVVLVGGFSNDYTIWLALAKLLLNDYQIILFDNRGAGQTDVPQGPYSIKQMAGDVAGLCKNLGIKQADFIGSSMGGFILQNLAVDYPQLVRSLIISNSTMNAQCVFHIYIDGLLQLLKARPPLEALIRIACSWSYSYNFLVRLGKLDEVIQQMLGNPHPFTLQGFEGQYAAICEFDSSSWARNISVPTLVLSGEEDIIFKDVRAKELADNIPGAQYFRFAGCGHLPQVEQPQQFAELVRNFIRPRE